MATIRVSFLSREEIRVPVYAKEAGAAINPTADAVAFAFSADGADPGSFTAGSWETDATTNPDTYMAQIQVGGTGSGATVALARGKYSVWVKVTNSPDVPVIRLADMLEIF